AARARRILPASSAVSPAAAANRHIEARLAGSQRRARSLLPKGCVREVYGAFRWPPMPASPASAASAVLGTVKEGVHGGTMGYPVLKDRGGDLGALGGGVAAVTLDPLRTLVVAVQRMLPRE